MRDTIKRHTGIPVSSVGIAIENLNESCKHTGQEGAGVMLLDTLATIEDTSEITYPRYLGIGDQLERLLASRGITTVLQLAKLKMMRRFKRAPHYTTKWGELTLFV